MNKQEHLLVLLMEECAEVQHACSKALRFGLHDKWPEKAASNIECVAQELIDVKAIAKLLSEECVLPVELTSDDALKVQNKIVRVKAMMNYSVNKGKLEVSND